MQLRQPRKQEERTADVLVSTKASRRSLGTVVRGETMEGWKMTEGNQRQLVGFEVVFDGG